MSATSVNSVAANTAVTAQNNQQNQKVAENQQSQNGVRAQVRNYQNAQIVQASLSLLVKSGNHSLSLFYSASLANIGESLSAAMDGKFGQSVQQAQNGQQAGAVDRDMSAEATAQRILDFATAAFDTYAERYPDGDADQAAKDFVNVIRSGFEKGFNEAKGILENMGVLKTGNVESDIGKTYDLVQKGLDDFLAAKLSKETEVDAGTGKAESTVAGQAVR